MKIKRHTNKFYIGMLIVMTIAILIAFAMSPDHLAEYYFSIK